ncbi:Glutamate racemase [Thermodesulfobacterium geofontis OPF15]|uniref:Glutamate racemase n=1 Tax=Thermodesulfobacterium geofontis (strain OPF15) TaxID=795359 RepID=F8C2G3_THEGP|nr:glutamate racemase [Thermodesulfobacterium geofontis]AEH22253.1 Glutamate racemase [Thermodesulfobacterium geofontis OPF15]
MIGIFDSGLGGLTVVKEILNKLPQYKIIYFGDTARTPYGTKSAETVKRYAIENTKFLLERGAKIIVVACHTVSSTAIPVLKEKFPNIPFFEVVTPSFKKALKLTKNKKIGLIGTRTTVESGIYDQLFSQADSEIKLYSNPAPLLVPLIEEGWLKKPETRKIVKKYLIPLKMKGIDTLILGCTHYPLIKKVIQEKAGKRIKLVDPSEEIALEVKNFIENTPELAKELQENGEPEIYVSDITPNFEKIAKLFLGRPIKLKKVNLE